MSFFDYFKLNHTIYDIVQALGYQFLTDEINFKVKDVSADPVSLTKNRIIRNLKHIVINNEIARRDFLIAPVLELFIELHPVLINVEYYIEVSNLLKGFIDYYIEDKHSFLLIEAKNADIQRGFNQLSAELIAVDQWTDNTTKNIFGAVSIGNVWQFAVLYRQEKRIIQDIKLYRVPDDLEQLLGLLLSIFEGEQCQQQSW